MTTSLMKHRYQITSADGRILYTRAEYEEQIVDACMIYFRGSPNEYMPIDIVDELGNESCIVWDKDSCPDSWNPILLRLCAKVSMESNYKLSVEEDLALRIIEELKIVLDKHIGTYTELKRNPLSKHYPLGSFILSLETLMRNHTRYIHNCDEDR